MGVNTKGKRKFVHGEKSYFWYVKEDDEDYGRIKLFIVSDDKKFIVSYEVGQSQKERIPYIVVMGLEFGGLENGVRSSWVRVQTPLWDDDVITPGLVKNIIKWGLMDKESLIFVDWTGNVIH
ncbi:hypothetical protein H1230_19950 [Paenibacillus sp. 19GGS1-52]|uniref:hypothetical protein n=1 Tax=Paenibacillus sp. 19GGS1-52 TaxID=2758563 RepID=UPI001EFB22C4|nr:hypothetical protein [Paenibacillus sp. 19GGS1-52]ULO05363.1 hypothetical protein H1230_19950 [Paenibacillus sp. 19GGS1-52]